MLYSGGLRGAPVIVYAARCATRALVRLRSLPARPPHADGVCPPSPKHPATDEVQGQSRAAVIAARWSLSRRLAVVAYHIRACFVDGQRSRGHGGTVSGTRSAADYRDIPRRDGHVEAGTFAHTCMSDGTAEER